MNPTGSETTIVVVDGVDGLTPDMLRGPNRGWGKMLGLKYLISRDVPPNRIYLVNEKNMIVKPNWATDNSRSSQG